MPTDINHLVDAYGQFEAQIRRWTEAQCRPFCANCRTVCCRAHFCDETRESVFLSRVAGRWSPRSVYHPSAGWLTPAGCSLRAGRPPVCYEFLCHELSTALATDPIRRHALLVVSMLVSHVGRRALGGRHLVTLTRQRDLQRIRPDRLLARLDEARLAFQAAMELFAGRRGDRAVDALSRIVAAPADR